MYKSALDRTNNDIIINDYDYWQPAIILQYYFTNLVLD